MDILDGKQARRTKTDGILDEYFDHGCDAISAVFIAIGASITLQLGVHPSECFFMCFVGLGVFYTAHWQTFDAVESQGAIAVTHFITALIGPGIWSYEIYGHRINFYLLVVSTVVALVALHRSFEIIFSRGSTVAVAQMSKSPVDFVDTVFIGPMMIFVNQYMGLPISNENLVLSAALKSGLNLGVKRSEDNVNLNLSYKEFQWGICVGQGLKKSKNFLKT
ncbi:cholinephosphotransferase 1-like [Anneissia japonica]|uniref:cholinephosphotransferase 1-like n=1 Tax=Anneissia japonica TaxID=1529436 RepID=UPI001425B466|nr:cholinephosphotransferase 1-like [Anneissia japonica]